MCVAEEGPLSGLLIEELLRRARTGDQQALEALLEHATRWLTALASRPKHRLPPGGPRPSDVVQEVTLRAFKGLSSFRGSTEPELNAWLKEIFLNQIAQALRDARRQKRHATEVVPLDAPEPQAVQAQQRSPSQAAAHQEHERLLLANILKLPDAQREAIYLCHLAELPVADVAKQLNKTKEAVSSLLQRGLKALRTQMAQEPEPGTQPVDPAGKALLELLERRDRGETIDPEAFAALHPECADELRGSLRLIEQLQALRPPRRSS